MVRDHEKQQKREIHYPNVDGKDFHLDYNRHKPSDYITNNLAISHDSLEDKSVYVRDDKQIKSVKKELKNEDTEYLKDIYNQKEVAPKAVPFKLLKVCDRLLKQTQLKSNDIKIEVAIHYCRELLDTLFEKDTPTEISTENKDKVIDFKTNSNEDSGNECSHCLRYIFGSIKGMKDEDRVLNKKRPLSHLPPGPNGWFGPYNGRRDWMVLNENYPGMLRSYLNRFKKKIFN
ncbi:hypothetical protein O3G_MSEX000254 [Manduca sexta]|nr:hypothetical protein O3G_MSEX000254 [Manduca sexta]KAG6438824.1 hypothetical protein O3G_MSEX000254 [Manduca sexta]